MHCFTYILVGYSSGGSEGVVVGVVGVVVIGEGGIVQRGAECLRCRRPIYRGRSLDICVYGMKNYVRSSMKRTYLVVVM